MKQRNLLGWTLVCVLLTSACSTHPARVNCDAHLRPINTPQPVKATPAVKP
jgi:hypothetical protein